MASANYLGNPQLKNTGVKIQFSEDTLVEYAKCAEDPIYFIKTYCKIVSLDHGLINFELYEYQINFINNIHQERKVISMQPRQMGKTQTVAAYILWYSLFNATKTVAILANKAIVSREILSRYKMMFEYLPDWLQQGIITWNKGDIELENHSKVFTGATSASGIRSKSCNFLYVDEVAIVPNTIADEFFTSTYPVVSAGATTKIVLTSTPLGYNHFWKFWNEAETGANGFIPIRVHYTEHPNRDQKWADEQRANLGELKYTQEVLCSFLGSSSTLIDANVLATMSGKHMVYSKDGLDLVEPAIPDHNYIMCVDTAKGVGGDYSAIAIIDVTKVPYRLVGKYRDNKISPLLFPSVIHKIAREFNMAHVLFELNVTEQVPHILHYEMEYENILMVSRTMKGQIAAGGFGGGKTQLGVLTDKKTKRIGCNTIKSIIEMGKLEIFDVDVISELSTFIQVKDSYAADDGYHDDLAMTLVLFGWLTTQSYFKDINNVDLRKAMYQNHMDLIDMEMLPIGMRSDGTETDDDIMLNF